MTRHNPREPNWEYCVACIIAIVMVWIILSTSVKSYYRELRDQPSPTNTVEKTRGVVWLSTKVLRLQSYQ